MAQKAVEKQTDKKVAKKDTKKLGFFKKAIKFLRECKGEIKKISWPTAKQTTKNFGVVLAVIVIVGRFIFALDQGLYALLNLVMQTSAT